MHICAWACLYLFINRIYSLSMDKARVLHQVESLPYNCRHCNWSHVSQMREFQTLLDFSGTRMSCGSGPEGSKHYTILLVQKKEG